MTGTPSARVVSLLRRAAADALIDTARLDAVNEETVVALPLTVHSDPELGDGLRAVNRANVVHWLRHMADDPRAEVPAMRSRQAIALGRDLARRGHDASALNAYLSGQNVSWQYWMRRCFMVSDDVHEVEEMLELSAQSMFRYVQLTISELSRITRAERNLLTRGANAERLELVQLILQGSPVSPELATARLEHDVVLEQTAAVFWCDPSTPDLTIDAAAPSGLLEQAAVGAASAMGLQPPLRVAATASSLWVWFATPGLPDVGRLCDAAGHNRGVCVAVGSTMRGIDGFRVSHADAVETQRFMMRSPSGIGVATYDEVSAVSLMLNDIDRAHEFVRRTLGSLTTAEPALRDTLRVYLRADANAARAARALFTHRNTVINRLARAEALLPTPLDGHRLAIGLALEIHRWLGS